LGAEFTTRLEFSKNWGLGSSSTLINNLSLWAKIDPYDLLDLTFKGSGYDIACCNKINPITYVKNKNDRIIKDVDFNPSFKENLFFIYLGHKQDTSEAIENYRSMSNDIDNIIQKINSINLSIMKSNTLNEFEKLIVTHEEIISKTINIEPIKKRLFSDYQSGVIKSLGAWGGDFMLVTGNKSSMSYFRNKGYDEIIPYKDLVY
jgi:mevalonate kinase